MSQHGDDTMLAIYDRARLLRPGRAVVDRTVNLAVHGLLTSPATLDAAAEASDTLRGAGTSRETRRPGRRPGA
jgi:hypothetical protein